MANDPCPICLKPMCPPYSTSCGHAFCRRCLAEHFYRRHFVDTGKGLQGDACPYCRQPVQWCRPAIPMEGVPDHQSASSTPYLDLSMGKVAMRLLVPDSTPVLDATSSMFNVTKRSIKLIHHGQVVKSEQQLRALAERHAKLTFLSSRMPKRSYRACLIAWWRWVLALLLPMFRRLHAAARKLYLPLYRQVLMPAWQAIGQPAVQLVWAFLASISPSFKTGDERPASRPQPQPG